MTRDYWMATSRLSDAQASIRDLRAELAERGSFRHFKGMSDANLVELLERRESDLLTAEMQQREAVDRIEACQRLFGRYGIDPATADKSQLVGLIVGLAIASKQPGFEIEFPSPTANDRDVLRLGEMFHRIEQHAAPRRTRERIINNEYGSFSSDEVGKAKRELAELPPEITAKAAAVETAEALSHACEVAAIRAARIVIQRRASESSLRNAATFIAWFFKRRLPSIDVPTASRLFVDVMTAPEFVELIKANLPAAGPKFDLDARRDVRREIRNALLGSLGLAKKSAAKSLEIRYSERRRELRSDSYAALSGVGPVPNPSYLTRFSDLVDHHSRLSAAMLHVLGLPED